MHVLVAGHPQAVSDVDGLSGKSGDVSFHCSCLEGHCAIRVAVSDIAPLAGRTTDAVVPTNGNFLLDTDVLLGSLRGSGACTVIRPRLSRLLRV
jgi:hypothetical protein